MMIRRRAFSLAEILIVISIIVLMLALAVPAFNFITGSKSQASANNQIASILGRARSEAIGFQEVRGVVFFLDQASGRYTAMVVQQPFSNSSAGSYSPTVNYLVGQFATYNGGYFVSIQDSTGQTPAGDTGDAYWRTTDVNVIDSISDADSVILPSGVALQTICDSKQTTATNRASDGYLSTGAILFDSFGRIVDRPISIAYAGTVGQKMGLNLPSPTYPLKNMLSGIFESSFGFVLFDHDAFTTQGFSDNDVSVPNPQMAPPSAYNSGSPSEKAEETWLDANGSAVLVNRYNGSLIKSE